MASVRERVLTQAYVCDKEKGTREREREDGMPFEVEHVLLNARE